MKAERRCPQLRFKLNICVFVQNALTVNLQILTILKLNARNLKLRCTHPTMSLRYPSSSIGGPLGAQLIYLSTNCPYSSV